MIERLSYRAHVETVLKRVPICALLGPRQCGKTTLARQIVADRASHYFDLESPRDRLRLQNPELALGELNGLIVLDEVQAMPELFPVLRVLADRPEAEARFLILGSASPELSRQSWESLAGRVEFVDLHGFDLEEIGSTHTKALWFRGGFPRSYLASSDDDSIAWREGFALEQVLRLADRRDAYFWSTQSGAELDLLLFENGRRIGYDFKYAESPVVTRSMRIAVQDLRLDELRIVCPGDVQTRLDAGIELWGIAALTNCHWRNAHSKTLDFPPVRDGLE